MVQQVSEKHWMDYLTPSERADCDIWRQAIKKCDSKFVLPTLRILDAYARLARARQKEPAMPESLPYRYSRDALPPEHEVILYHNGVCSYDLVRREGEKLHSMIDGPFEPQGHYWWCPVEFTKPTDDYGNRPRTTERSHT